MIAELSASHKLAEMFRQLAHNLTGRMESKAARSGFLPPFISKLLKG
jgi:hypothetical protein